MKHLAVRHPRKDLGEVADAVDHALLVDRADAKEAQRRLAVERTRAIPLHKARRRLGLA